MQLARKLVRNRGTSTINEADERCTVPGSPLILLVCCMLGSMGETKARGAGTRTL